MWLFANIGHWAMPYCQKHMVLKLTAQCRSVSTFYLYCLLGSVAYQWRVMMSSRELNSGYARLRCPDSWTPSQQCKQLLCFSHRKHLWMFPYTDSISWYCCFCLLQKDCVAYYRYGDWWSVWWMGTYSMVVSKAACFHRKYLDLYTYQMPSSIHDYVTRERYSQNCGCSLVEPFYLGAIMASFSESCSCAWSYF